MNPKQQHNPLNILLADDDIDDCVFFKDLLKGFTQPTNCTVVHDGEQLMQLLTTETNKLPDALFLDLNMPRKNGFECLSEIMLNKKMKRFPIVMFSTSFEQDFVNLLYKNGAQYFIRKPSDFSQFKKIIHQTLTLISQGNILQPPIENFVITVKNS